MRVVSSRWRLGIFAKEFWISKSGYRGGVKPEDCFTPRPGRVYHAHLRAFIQIQSVRCPKLSHITTLVPAAGVRCAAFYGRKFLKGLYMGVYGGFNGLSGLAF